MKEVLKGERVGLDMIHMLYMTLRRYLKEFYPLSVCQDSKLKKK